MIRLKNFIDGQFSDTEEYLDGFCPATGKVYCQIPRSGTAEVERATAAAKRAQESWSSTPAADRARVLNRIADLIDENLDRLAEAESKDNGKPIGLARTIDIPRSAKNFRFFASSIEAFASESHPNPGSINFTLRRPLGIVGCISPWNLPLYLFTWKIAPALAAGNCVIAKPSEMTPMTAFLLAEICQQAELPPGVLNILHGLGAEVGDAIVRDPLVKAVSFTGGTKTGKIVGTTCAQQFKKCSLELGGKNPVLIFDDCQFEKMIETVLRSSFANQGQICLCGSRVLVQQSVFEKFKSHFIPKVKDLKVGDPNSNVDLGAVVSKEHQQKILDYIQLGKEEGGTVLAGGQRADVDGECSDGWFVEPTVFEGLPNHCRMNQEEIFGPVVSLIPFEDEDEAISLANDSNFGLASSVWTSDLSRAHRLSEKLETGIVWVNCWLNRDLRTPFGGMKQSGVGREGGLEALRFFTEPKNICIDYA